MSLPEQHSNSHSVIKHDRVRIETSNDVPSALPSHANSTAGSKGGARCKKSVQFLREKDVVRGIEVRCSCGEVTVVEIEYGPQAG
jgi:hypothetical protein